MLLIVYWVRGMKCAYMCMGEGREFPRYTSQGGKCSGELRYTQGPDPLVVQRGREKMIGTQPHPSISLSSSSSCKPPSHPTPHLTEMGGEFWDITVHSFLPGLLSQAPHPKLKWWQVLLLWYPTSILYHLSQTFAQDVLCFWTEDKTWACRHMYIYVDC